MRHAYTSDPPGGRRHGSGSLLALVASAAALAACGSSSPSRSAVGPGATPQGIRATDCMRSHGVPNLPDPSDGGGIQIPPGSNINPQSPAFQSALKACAYLLPGGGPGRHRASAQAKAQALQTAQCMRQHGVSGFPDPMQSLPANPADYSELENQGGLITGIPKSINTGSPVFKRAAAACSFTS
jgi:hypothetical protein